MDLQIEDIDDDIALKNKDYVSRELASYKTDGYLHCEYRCPKCKKNNWLYHGDMDDMTGIDYFSCKCWDCNHIFWVGEIEDVRENHLDEFTECNGDLELMLKENNSYGDGEENPPWNEK